MKKLIFTFAVALCAMGASAQTLSSIQNSLTTSENWAVGLRIGSGFQAVAEYKLPSRNYIEGRFGMSWLNGGATLMADFTALYNWHICDMDWTPGTGSWFFDAGCGVVVGGREHYAYVGAAGCVKLGIAFDDVPLSLSIDWTPYIGPEIAYGSYDAPVLDSNGMPEMDSSGNLKFKNHKFSNSRFNEYGFANFGISCVYRF